MSDERRHVILHLCLQVNYLHFFALSNTEMSCSFFTIFSAPDILPLAKEASARCSIGYPVYAEYYFYMQGQITDTCLIIMHSTTRHKKNTNNDIAAIFFTLPSPINCQRHF